MKQISALELLEALKAISDIIADNDSAGGSLTYEWSNTPGMYNVEAAIRTGNSMGQGGVMLL